MTDTMTTKSRKTKAEASKLFPDELIDQLLAQVRNKDAESIPGESGLANSRNTWLAAELTHHLTEVAQQPAAGNHRNGTSPKTVITPGGELQLDIPRDRLATFEPQLVAKYQRRLPGFDDHVISMYARGMSARDSGASAGAVWPASITRSDFHHYRRSADRGRQWQMRPLEAMYPIVYFDALRLKIREGTVRNKAVYLALGIRSDGRKEVLGLWIEQTEVAPFVWTEIYRP